jgi:hypothetical protein
MSIAFEALVFQGADLIGEFWLPGNCASVARTTNS